MRNAIFPLIIATALTSAVAEAQQGTSNAAQPAQTQAKPAPCSPSPLTKRIHPKVPVWLQKQIDKQQAKLGGSVDLNGMIQDATAPRPCTPATNPAPSTPALPQTNPKP